jgi:hypothetical protein
MDVHRFPGTIHSLALSPDDSHLAVGLSNGVVQVLRLDQQQGRQRGIAVWSLDPLALQKSDARAPPVAIAPTVAMSFSADGSQLAAVVRDESFASAYTSLRPFTSRKGPLTDRYLGVVC